MIMIDRVFNVFKTSEKTANMEGNKKNAERDHSWGGLMKQTFPWKQRMKKKITTGNNFSNTRLDTDKTCSGNYL